MSEERNIQPQPESGLPPEVITRFEEHLPLLERVVSQVLASSTGSVRDLIYLGAAVLLRAAAEWTPDCGLAFKEYAEVTITSELLHHMHYPVPVLHLPEAIASFAPRLNAMAQALAHLQPQMPLAITTYQAAALRHPALAGAYAPMPMPMMPSEFYGGAPHGAHKSENVMGTVWKLFRKRMPLILGLVLLTEVGITGYTLKSPKTYVADTTLNSGIGTKDPINGGADWFTEGTIVANLTELIKSRTVLENTIASLSLNTTPDKLAKDIDVTRIGATGLLKVEAQADTAQDSAELANTLVREFLRFYIASQTHEARSNKSFFESQVADASKRLHEAESRLKAFKAANVPEMAAAMPTHVSDLMAQRDEAARSLAASQAALSAVERELARIKGDPLLRERIINNQAVMTQTDKLRELEMNLLDARDIYGKDSDVVRRLEGQVARAKSQLHTAAADASEQNPALADANAKVVGLKADIAMNAARLSSLNAEIARQEPQARSASTNQVTYEQLQREVTIAAAEYQDLETKYGQSNLAAQGAANLNISVVDPAIPPKEPLSSKLVLKLILGLILSLGLGLFISFLMSLREKPDEQADASDQTPSVPPKLLNSGLSA